MPPPRARLAAGLLGCALVAVSGGARGVTFTVSSTADSGLGTLREAITLANAATGPDTIAFAVPADSVIQLQSALPNVRDPLQVDGGALNVTVMGIGNTPLVTLDATALSVEIMDVNLVQGGIAVANGVAFKLDQTLIAGTVPGVISGAGALEKLGPEMLTLEGTNTYSGGTTVRAGTLQGSSVSLQGNIAVESGAALVFDQAQAGTYAGNLSGQGGLTKSGAGTLTLTGTNTHSGGTSVEAGILQGNTVSLPGNIAVTDGAELIFNQTANGSFAGNLSGGPTAVVRKQGAGQLTLGGNNAGFNGEFSFEDGTLFVSTSTAPPTVVNRGNVQNEAVVIQQNFNGSFTGRITGEGGTSAGSVSKAGSGDVALQGEIRAGTFVVVQGPFTLTDVGIFDGEFRLNSGTTLQGQSLAANVTGFAQLAGNVAPGGAGNVAAIRTSFNAATFLPASALLIDVNGSNVDLFDATSVAVQNGARLELSLQGDPVVVDKPLVTTTNGITGSFTFDQDFFFFTVTLEQQPNQLLLTITALENAFSAFAETDNQMAVAQVLDASEAELGDFFAALDNLQEADVPALLDAMSGEIATSFATPRLAAKQRLDRNLELAVRGFAARSPSFVPGGAVESAARGSGMGLPGVGAASGPGVLMAFAPEPGETGFGAWLDGYGVFGTAEGNGNAGDVDYGVYGTTLGVDARLSEHFLIGAAAGYARVEPDLRSASGQGNVGQGALFAAAVWDRLHLAGWGRYAFGGYETERPIGFGVDVVAKGSFDGWDTSGHGEVGLRVLELGGFELRPLGTIDYAYLEQDGYTEQGAIVGADSLNLSVPSQSWTSLVSGLGARVHRVWELDEGIWFVPELHGRWLHEFEDTDRRVVPTLIGAGLAYSPFISGAELSRDGFVAGIGWTVSSQTGLHVYADYEVSWNQQLLQNAIEAGFRFLF